LQKERRRWPRFAFYCSTFLFEPVTKTRVSTGVRKINLHGCYVHLPFPYLVGTRLELKIYSGADSFEASTTVVHADHWGMGLAFDIVKPQFTAVLKKWLLASSSRNRATSA
jgi:hypothetical protein